LLTLLAAMGGQGVPSTISQMSQPNGSTDSEPHDTHTVWFTDAIVVSLSGEQLGVALNDTSGGVVSTYT
jgi:hypothetical protein